jgi:hypothetical protein
MALTWLAETLQVGEMEYYVALTWLAETLQVGEMECGAVILMMDGVGYRSVWTVDVMLVGV